MGAQNLTISKNNSFHDDQLIVSTLNVAKSVHQTRIGFLFISRFAHFIKDFLCMNLEKRSLKGMSDANQLLNISYHHNHRHLNNDSLN